MAIPYSSPTITIQATGAQALVSSQPQRPTILALGTAPQGPDVPMLIDPVNAPTLYGDPANSTSLGYTLPMLMRAMRGQRPPLATRISPQFCVCRVGVTRSSVAVPHPTNVNQVWTLTFAGPPTGGTFTLTYNAVTTSAITYSATPLLTAGNIQAALNALSSVGSGNSTVAVVDATHFTITAAGTLAASSLANFTTAGGSLTGAGAGVSSAITTTGQGTTGLGLTVYGVGPYAGTAGNNLAFVVATNQDNSIASLTLYDTAGQAAAGTSPFVPGTLWQFLQQLTPDVYDLSSCTAIVNAINSTNPLVQPSALMQATIGTVGASLPTAGVYLLTGGANGKGTAVSDSSVAAMLNASLPYSVDYIVAGYDANAIESTMMTHLGAALGRNQFRQAVLGPQSGTTYATLVTQAGASSGWYNNFQSARGILVGHDSVLMPNPVTGFLGQYDGFYLAAAVCGIKATSPIEETCIGFPLDGVAGIPLPSDLTAPLSPTQKDTLGGAGFIVCHVQDGAFCIRDALTSAPFSVNNGINPFSQWNLQTIDDAVSRVLLAAVLPFRGRPMPSIDVANSLLQGACTEAMASLGQAINGVQNITVTTDPVSLVPTVDVVYITRFPFREIVVRTSYVFV